MAGPPPRHAPNVPLDGGVEAQLGVSIGVAVRQPGEPTHAVLAAADAAMYADKARRAPARQAVDGPARPLPRPVAALVDGDRD